MHDTYHFATNRGDRPHRPRTARPTIVLIHGAWHGPWAWSTMHHTLRAKGWNTTGPRLRSVPLIAREQNAGLADDIAALQQHIDRIDGPVALVAHSYAGMPATELAALRPDKVTHLIYLAAYVPRTGDSVYSLHGLPTPEFATGTVAVPDNPIDMFYADVDRATALTAAIRLRPHSLRSWIDRAHIDRPVTTPTTFLICSKDRALPPSMQETFAARTHNSQRLNSGHSPFLSQPQDLTARIELTLLESPAHHAHNPVLAHA